MTNTLKDYAQSIANSKADMITAMTARGMIVTSADKLEDFADIITNAVIPGSGGDSITATNLTGSNISIGDKVFVKENVAVSQSYVEFLTSGRNSDMGIVNSEGDYVWTYTSYSSGYSDLYDIAQETSAPTTVGLSQLSYNALILQYDFNNVIHFGKYLFGGTETTYDYCQDYYTVTDVQSGSTLDYIELNLINSDYSIQHTWTVGSFMSREYASAYSCCVIGDKLYVSHLTSSSRNYIGTIDIATTSITVSQRTDNYRILYSTSDNKLAIGITGTVSGYATSVGNYSGITLLNLNSNYEIDSTFVSSNEDLNSILALSNVYMVFNRNTGILCLSVRNASTTYGMFKYNSTTHDFDTISLTLDDSLTQNCPIMSVSLDMSYLCFGKYLYTMEQTSGGYKAIPYSGNMGSDVLTGFATSAASHGSNFTAETVTGAS